jgi:hypothetical protein
MPIARESQKKRKRAKTIGQIIKAQMAKTTGYHNEATKSVEIGSRSCIHVLWNGSETTVRQMDWPSDSSFENFLQSRNKKNCHFDD